MSNHSLFIFRSGELFLREDNTLPPELPAALAGEVHCSLPLSLPDGSPRVVLLSDTRSREEQVSASVSGPAAAQPGSGQVPGKWVRLRTLVAAGEPALASLAAPAPRAAGIVNWYSVTRFCSRCGTALEDHPSELARRCPSCGSVVFPRLSPAIIVLVRKEGKILLARHSYRNQDVFSCIAGFVEHGESLEECVAREVFEETSLRIRDIRYAGSQSWPYPDQYMIAFYADWASGDIRVDPAELIEAQWFDPEHLPNHPMRGTVASRLIYGDFPGMSGK